MPRIIAREKTTRTGTVRIYLSDRDTLNAWCIKKDCSMPRLMKTMIEYGIQRRDQAFYESLPKPSRLDSAITRMKRSILPSVGKINRIVAGVYK